MWPLIRLVLTVTVKLGNAFGRARMNPTKHLLRSQVKIGRVGCAGFRVRAVILAVLSAGVLVPAAAAQTPFDMTMDMDMGAGFPADATMPDPLAAAEKMLQCGEASSKCMDAVWDAAMPSQEPSPPPPAPAAPPQPSPPPAPAAPAQPQPASPSQPDDSGGPSDEVAAAPPAADGQSGATSSESAANETETGTPPPLVQDRTSSPPGPAPEAAPLRAPDAMGLPAAAPSLPGPLQPGPDGSPLFLTMLVAAAGFALVLWLVAAAPRHSPARVSYQLAQRRYDLAMMGVVMAIGLTVGYLVAIWVG
jgi:hypothetical protein